MTDYAFPTPDVVSLPIAGQSSRFPVRRIFCVGRNYAAHAAEMGNEVDRNAPFYFTKAAYSVIESGGTLAYPGRTNDFHYEMELAVMLGAGGRNVSRGRAEGLIFGYSCALDMTRRDLQAEAKEKRRPWDVAKDFDQSAVLGMISANKPLSEVMQSQLRLRVNDEIRQSAPLSDMIHDIPALVSDLSELYTLAAGDIILTGTPAGVGAVRRGDRLNGSISGLNDLSVVVE